MMQREERVYVQLFCDTCKKRYRVPKPVFARVKRHHPERFRTVAGLPRFYGGCFFKAHTQLLKEAA